jgi:hypothetical protein
MCRPATRTLSIAFDTSAALGAETPGNFRDSGGETPISSSHNHSEQDQQ